MKTFTVLAAVCALIGSARPALAAPDIRDLAELETFVDGVMTSALNDKHVAGGTVAIVYHGQVLLMKGYGWSDVEHRRPADGTHTLFRLGSITKLFTWSAAMQLVEAGALDPLADVNRYLDFQIPATYPKPITLADLATHTAGFEDDGRDLWTTDAREIQRIGVWLSRHLPTRVRPPGLWTSYSNHGAALAGHMVERISGLEWCDYVERRILVPLGMFHTSCRQPIPAPLAADVSQGYLYRDGRFVPQPGEMLTGAAPAGAMAASAADMAIFMLAQLGHRRSGQTILSEASLSSMHRRWFGHDPALPGIAFGFYESWSHGLHMIGHEGDTRWFHTNLVLVPSTDLGVFVAFNTNTAALLSADQFLTRFFDHYYPTPPLAPPPPSPDAVAQARRVAGEYESLRRSFTTFQRALGLAGPSATFTADANGRLTMTWGLGEVKLVPAGPLKYRDQQGAELVLFNADASGHVTRAFVGSAPMLAFEPIPWYRSPRLHWAILAVATLSFAVAIVVTAALSLRRIVRRLPRPATDAAGGLIAAALTYLVFAVAMAVLTSDPIPMLSGSMVPVRMALLLPPIGLVLVVISAGLVIRDWHRKIGSTARRTWHTVFLMLTVLFTWSLSIWNLLWWQV